jgi:hypothetical protein
MQINRGPVLHQGKFMATVEKHEVWRYVIRQADDETVLYDGWGGDLAEAVETADRQLSFLCDAEASIRKAS